MNSKLPTGLQTLNFSRQCRSQILLNTVTMSAFKSIDALYNQIGWVTEVKVHIEENLLVKVNKLCSFTLHLATFRQWWCGIWLAVIGTQYILDSTIWRGRFTLTKCIGIDLIYFEMLCSQYNKNIHFVHNTHLKTKRKYWSKSKLNLRELN